MVKDQPRTTKKKVCKELASAGIQARLKFASNHKDKDKTFWKKVPWSDETKTELFGHNAQQYVWRKKGEEHNANCQVW